MAGLSVSVLESLKSQYVHEIHNSHIYKYAACWANYNGLLDIEKFFLKQSSDEIGHADIIYKYVTDRGEKISPVLTAVDATLPESGLGVFRFSFELEQLTTEKLKAIYRLAHGEGDYLTAGWVLSGLIAEQVEEEDTFQTIIDRFEARLNDRQASEFDPASVGMASEPGAVLHDMDVWIGDTYLG